MSVFQAIADFFTNFNILAFVSRTADFLIIAVLIYSVLFFLRGTRSANVLFGIVGVIMFVSILVQYLDFPVLSYIKDTLTPMLMVIIVVIFQPEFRRAFAQAGSFFTQHNQFNAEMIDAVVAAAVRLSETRTGALIVFERNIGLEGIVRTAVQLDAAVNSKLLETIFYPNSPLHDCAVIIRDNRIVAARAVLPLAEEDLLPASTRHRGTRHRAAVGVTEETDAVVVVVSEETGSIGVARKGRLLPNQSRDDVAYELRQFLLNKQGKEQKNIASRSRGEMGA